VGRGRRGVAPSNVLCLLSESIRRNTHNRPTLASGEHGAPVQRLGLVVQGDFTHTNYRPGVGAGSAGRLHPHELPSRWLGLVVKGDFTHTTHRPPGHILFEKPDWFANCGVTGPRFLLVQGAGCGRRPAAGERPAPMGVWPGRIGSGRVPG
jgi:hypothetical protein